MSRVPDFFGLGGENNLTNYNFYDVISGEGYITYYLGQGTSTYIPKSTSFYSENMYTSSTQITEANYTKKLDLDWDINVNRQMEIRGTALFSIPLLLQGGDNNKYGSHYCVVYFRKYSGSTETDIATAQGTTFDGTATQTLYRLSVIPVTIPITIYSKGDKIRITIELWAKAVNALGSNPEVRLGYDPKGRTDSTWTDTTITTLNTIDVPVRIDV
jgi:hypothetical protein